MSAGASLCLPLDGVWGAGKTAFVTRWMEDLRGQDYPVVMFDAWKNDLSDEPLNGFIAALKEGLEPWAARLPALSDASRQERMKRASNFLGQASRAAVPLGMSIAKNIFTRYAGQEAVDMLSSSGMRVDADRGTDTGLQTEKAFEDFVDRAISSHIEQKNAIAKLQNDLAALLKYIDESTEARLPLFVFIDELDRCRPDYAIRLIEGVKHLFNIPGVCFVFSTNLQQLSEAVKAVYGAGFDGFKYLKRFFDFEYRLPIANNLAFATLVKTLVEYPNAAISETLKRLRLLDGSINFPAANSQGDIAPLDTSVFQILDAYQSVAILGASGVQNATGNGA